MSDLTKIITLTDAEEFIFSLGNKIEKMSPGIIEKDKVELRTLARIAGGIVADMMLGGGGKDTNDIYKSIQWGKLFSSYREIKSKMK